MELEELSRDVDAATAHLERVTRRLALFDDGRRTFGADGPGQLGSLGRALSALQAGALTARAHEAARAGVVAADLADGLRRAAPEYREVESGSAHGS